MAEGVHQVEWKRACVNTIAHAQLTTPKLQGIEGSKGQHEDLQCRDVYWDEKQAICCPRSQHAGQGGENQQPRWRGGRKSVFYARSSLESKGKR